MKNLEHTSGPWEVELDSQFEHDIVDKHGNVIATAIGEPQIELLAQQANARLIAACPDLLKALQEMVVDMRVMSREHQEGMTPVSCDEAEKLIAKIVRE